MWKRIVTVNVRAIPSFCLTCTSERLMSILEGKRVCGMRATIVHQACGVYL